MFSAEPSSIIRGQSSTLRWEVTGDVTSVSLEEAGGAVRNSGRVRVSPDASATYKLTAKGPGGSTTSMVTVNVYSALPPINSLNAGGVAKGSLEERLSKETQDAFFDYGRGEIRPDAREALASDATALKSILADIPDVPIVIEGHTDERGSPEYNLALADVRAASAREVLLQFGLKPDRLKIVSYGKERQQCQEPSESCWQKNRRVHLSAGTEETDQSLSKR